MYNERDRVGLSRSRAIEKIALFYVAVLAGLLHRFPANFTQQTAGQIRNRESGGSAGAKASEQGEEITFADVAGVDEAKSRARRNCGMLGTPLFPLISPNESSQSLEDPKGFLLSSEFLFMPMFSGQEFLWNPDKYIRLGARPPRGVLLVSYQRLINQ
ncbi:unnamed protein product [Malus baccata var. baccata]